MSVQIRAGEVETVSFSRTFDLDVHTASSVTVGIGTYDTPPSSWSAPASSSYSVDGYTLTVTVALGNGGLNSTGSVWLWVKLVIGSQTFIERFTSTLIEYIGTGGTAPDTFSQFVETVTVNGTTYEPDNDGDVDLGTIAGGGGAVSSVFARTGAVVAQSGDYAAFYQPLDSDLTAIAALSTTSFGRALLTAADAAAVRTAAGLGDVATHAASEFQPLDSDLTAIAALATTAFGRGLLTLADAAALLSAAGAAAAVHTHAEADVTGLVADLAAKQPLDADLTAIAALTTTSFGRSFLELADAAAGRTLIGAAATSHTHAESDVTNLTADLAAKASKAQAIGYALIFGGI